MRDVVITQLFARHRIVLEINLHFIFRRVRTGFVWLRTRTSGWIWCHSNHLQVRARRQIIFTGWGEGLFASQKNSAQWRGGEEEAVVSLLSTVLFSLICCCSLLTASSCHGLLNNLSPWVRTEPMTRSSLNRNSRAKSSEHNDTDVLSFTGGYFIDSCSLYSYLGVAFLYWSHNCFTCKQEWNVVPQTEHETRALLSGLHVFQVDLLNTQMWY